MKIEVEDKDNSFSSLNSLLDALSKVMNNHLLADGNKINLSEKTDDSFDSYHSKRKHNWTVKFSIEWKKVPIKK